MSVLVVGGGITGLTTAWALGRAGVPTTLVESADRLGGKIGTLRRNGYLVERGPDSFISYRPAALELVRELGLGDTIIRPTEPRTVLIRARDRFAHLPDGMGLVLPTRMRPFVTSDLFSPFDKLRMGLDLVLPRSGDDGDVAVGPFLRRRLGDAAVSRLAGPLIGGVYGTPVDELSVDAVVPQLREAERDHRSLLLASLAAGRARRGSPGGSPFVTLADGSGRLVEALVDAIGRLPDIRVLTGVPVRSLVGRAGAFDAVLGGHGTERAEAVILTTPGPVAAGLLDDLASDAAAGIRTIPHGGTAVVSLGYRLDAFRRPPVGHGFLVAAGETLVIDACTYSSQKWTGRAPDGSILLRCFVGSHRPEALWRDDETLVAQVRANLTGVLGVRGAPDLVDVARFPLRMPHYTVGHLARLARIGDALHDVPGLFLAGAPYRGVGMPDCITQGHASAAAAAAFLGGGEPAVIDRTAEGPAAIERPSRVAVPVGAA